MKLKILGKYLGKVNLDGENYKVYLKQSKRIYTYNFYLTGNMYTNPGSYWKNGELYFMGGLKINGKIIKSEKELKAELNQIEGQND